MYTCADIEIGHFLICRFNKLSRTTMSQAYVRNRWNYGKKCVFTSFNGQHNKFKSVTLNLLHAGEFAGLLHVYILSKVLQFADLTEFFLFMVY